MIVATRAKLIAAGRRAFASKGYADTAMEDLTADAELTRGALYHHFGGKKGLLAAVIAQIDAETSQRLKDILEQAPTLWEGFVEENVAWVKLALEAEVRRIVLLDGPAVLGDQARWANQSTCLADTQHTIERLVEQAIVKPIDPEAAAYLVNGAALNASLWIATSNDPDAASVKAIAGLRALLTGLRLDA
ncbi:TetR/AcrR family transcriptional regulator [Glacieibacterium frigidum]|uniref:TetR/AcrR family transcriptional regulator n=1 Tax=Glacieibacterium frigidum TaxID=2593303 RepID=A0A552U8B3_9SPHN|nr:TetR/AcrR family transcriptional regulator [Glacieibacterium frigidum]TRW14464.1 TetR/AcrR family transcriptional regulator [Glacieibacterium frigidum]